MKKMISLSDRYLKYLKDESKKLQIAESEFIRRLLDKHRDEKEKDNE